MEVVDPLVVRLEDPDRVDPGDHQLRRVDRQSDAAGIGQIVWSPIAQGVLTGKYVAGQPHPAGSRATDENGGAGFVARWLEDDVLNRVQALRPIAADVDLSLAQLAVAWVLQNASVSAAIIGASRPEQVTENAKASGAVLDASILARIDEVLGDAVQADPAETRSPARRP